MCKPKSKCIKILLKITGPAGPGRRHKVTGNPEEPGGRPVRAGPGVGGQAPLQALDAVRAAAGLGKKALWVDGGSLKATAIDWTCGGPVPWLDLEIHVHWIQA